MGHDDPRGDERRAELRSAPWRKRPRRSVPQLLNSPSWRLVLLPFILAPMTVGSIVWRIRLGLPVSADDWALLGVSLLPWLFLLVWLPRPTARNGRFW